MKLFRIAYSVTIVGLVSFAAWVRSLPPIEMPSDTIWIMTSRRTVMDASNSPCEEWTFRQPGQSQGGYGGGSNCLYAGPGSVAIKTKGGGVAIVSAEHPDFDLARWGYARE